MPFARVPSAWVLSPERATHIMQKTLGVPEGTPSGTSRSEARLVGDVDTHSDGSVAADGAEYRAEGGSVVGATDGVVGSGYGA